MAVPSGARSLPSPPDPGVRGRADTDTDRQVVTTASAFLAVEDPADGAQRVSELVEAAGGRVDERSELAGPARTGSKEPSPTSWCGCRRTR